MIGMLGRCGPLSLLGAGLVLTVAGLLVHDLTGALVGLAAEAVLLPILVGRTPFSPVRLVPGLVAVLSIAWSNWVFAPGHAVEPALLAAARVAFFVLPGLVFVSYVDPFTLGDHLGQRLRLPARPVLAGVAALQQLDSFAEDWVTLDRARRARGLGPGRGPISRARHVAALALVLLVQSIRQAGDMTVAMQARGYSAAPASRTWAEPAPWRAADTVLMLLALALGVVPAVAATLLP